MVKQWQKLAALKYVCFINILRSNEGGINNWMFLICSILFRSHSCFLLLKELSQGRCLYRTVKLIKWNMNNNLKKKKKNIWNKNWKDDKLKNPVQVGLVLMCWLILMVLRCSHNSANISQSNQFHKQY